MMQSTTKTMKIGQLAAQAGVGIDTVRFYERAGLMPRAGRSLSGYRSYGAADLQRLLFIRRAKALGFTLQETAELLQLSSGQGSREAVKAVTEHRLADLRQKIAELTALHDTLERYARRCSGQGALSGCPIVEAIVAPATPTETPTCTLHTLPTPRPPRRKTAARSRP